MTNRTDNFNRADTTNNIGTPSDGGSAWVVLSGSWGIQSNKAYKSATSGVWELAYLESSIADADVQFTLGDIGTTPSYGIAGRVQDTSNYLIAYVLPGGSQTITLGKFVAGVFSQIGNFYAGPLVTGDVIKFRMNGSSLKIYLNGAAAVVESDSTYLTNTKHGLTSYDAVSGTNVDNFSITALPETPSAGSSPTGSYAGQFATNCSLCALTEAGRINAMNRSRHIARTSVTSIQVAFPNWVINYPADMTEVGGGGAMTLTAAIEYGGTSTAFKWSGSSSVVIADGGQSALSDALSITIPAGDAFFIRTFYTIAGGNVITQTGTGQGTAVSCADNTNGEDYHYSTTDQTAGTGAITGGTAVTGRVYRPILLVSTLPAGTKSFLLLGDSRMLGGRDGYTGTSSDKGLLARTVGPKFGYTNIGLSSDSTRFFIQSHAKRIALAAYFSHVICELGYNDLHSPISIGRNEPAPVVAENIATINGYFSIPVHQSTINPSTSSTDLWATTANQTLDSANTARITLNNTYIRAAAIPTQAGYVEVADVLESARDSGKWAVNGTNNWYTDDGTHEVNTANIAVQAALSNTPLFTAPAAVAAATSTVVISGFQPPPALSDEFSILTRRAFVGTEKPVVSKMKSPRGQWGRGMKQT